MKAQQGSSQRKFPEKEWKRSSANEFPTDLIRKLSEECILCGTIEESVQDEESRSNRNGRKERRGKPRKTGSGNETVFHPQTKTFRVRKQTGRRKPEGAPFVAWVYHLPDETESGKDVPIAIRTEAIRRDFPLSIKGKTERKRKRNFRSKVRCSTGK